MTHILTDKTIFLKYHSIQNDIFKYQFQIGTHHYIVSISADILNHNKRTKMDNVFLRPIYSRTC